MRYLIYKFRNSFGTFFEFFRDFFYFEHIYENATIFEIEIFRNNTLHYL